jgi:hypothetical protein
MAYPKFEKTNKILDILAKVVITFLMLCMFKISLLTGFGFYAFFGVLYMLITMLEYKRVRHPTSWKFCPLMFFLWLPAVWIRPVLNIARGSCR